MAPNPRVVKAFRAMRDLGIPEEKTKPVLKRLIKLYEKNWELIEEENYTVLIEAILDSEESEAVEPKKNHDAETAEKKKQLEQAERMKAIEQETQIQEETERPLKRLRSRHQEGQIGQSSPSSINPSTTSNGNLLIKPKQEVDEVPEPVSPLKRKGKQPISPNDSTRVEGNDIIQSGDVVVADATGSYSAIRRLRDKGKQPISPQSNHREKKSVKSSDVHFKQPNFEPGVNNTLKQKNLALIVPKDKPLTDVPLSVVMPESLTNGDASDNHVEETSNGTNGHELMNLPEEPTKLDIASSSSGEIKISLTCKKTTLSVTNVDTLLKTIESKCLKSYKVLDPNFSVKKLMKDMCDSFLDLGSNSTNEPLATIDVTPPTEPSGTPDKKTEQNGIVENTESFDDVTDIAKGQENVIISLVNEVNTECPPSFHYIPKNAVFQNAYVNFSLACISDDNCCPTCYGDCLTSSTCTCAIQSGGEFAYTSEGLVKEQLLDECIKMIRDPQKRVVTYCKECPLERSKNEEILEQCKGHLERSFIKECWLKCGCNKKCGNRVVQCGIKYKLEVFMTNGGKGWGVRTLEDLPKGAFVCEYVGEVLTNTELYNRVSQSLEKDEYAHPVLLDADWGGEGEFKDEEALCLDATYYGNVARFINHRCFDSNLVEIPVEVENPDRHYYHLAFFTTRKVKALEELTRDYGIDFDDDDHFVKAFRCQCGSSYCRDIKPSTRSRKRRLT